MKKLLKHLAGPELLPTSLEKKNFDESRTKELQTELENMAKVALDVIEHGHGTNPVKRKLKEDLNTAVYLLKRALNGIEAWAGSKKD